MRSVTTRANWRYDLQSPAESWPQRQTIHRQWRPVAGFDCADDVIVRLRWAPDCLHKSGLDQVLNRCFAVDLVGQVDVPSCVCMILPPFLRP